MQITISDELAAAARLAELSEGDTQRAWIIGLFAESRLTLSQAAQLAGLDRSGFERHLSARGFVAVGNVPEVPDKEASEIEEKPWLALRGTGHYVGDPFAPVFSDEELDAMQQREADMIHHGA